MSEILRRPTKRMYEQSWREISSLAMQMQQMENGFIDRRFNLVGHLMKNWKSALSEMETIFEAQHPSGYVPLHDSSNSGGQFDHENILYVPVFGFILWKTYKCCKDKKVGRQILREFFPRILQYHYYLYRNRNYNGDGLIHIWHHEESRLSDPAQWRRLEVRGSQRNGSPIQDPFFNSLLVCSNDALIKIADLLQRDAAQILEWNDLTIHSMNEKLWDQQNCLYHPFDIASDRFLPAHPILGYMPLIGEIPDQRQADAMSRHLHNSLINVANKEKRVPSWKDLHTEIFCHWLLAEGCKKYSFKQLAKKLKETSYRKITQKHKLGVAPLFDSRIDQKIRENINTVFFRLN